MKVGLSLKHMDLIVVGELEEVLSFLRGYKRVELRRAEGRDDVDYIYDDGADYRDRDMYLVYIGFCKSVEIAIMHLPKEGDGKVLTILAPADCLRLLGDGEDNLTEDMRQLLIATKDMVARFGIRLLEMLPHTA